MAKKWPLAIATYILIPLVKVLSDGGDEVQYQGFCLIFDIDGASSIKIFTLLSIFVWVKLVVPKSDLFLCTVLQPAMSRSVLNLSQNKTQESENGSFMFGSFSQVLVPYLCHIKKVLSNYEKA